MKRYLFLFSLLLFSACGTLGTLDNSGGKLKPLVDIVAGRFENYVKADESKTEAEKAVLLIDSARFRRPFSDPKGGEIVVTAELRSFFLDFLGKHDAYVLADGTKDADTIALALFSSDNIRRTVNEVQIE